MNRRTVILANAVLASLGFGFAGSWQSTVSAADQPEHSSAQDSSAPRSGAPGAAPAAASAHDTQGASGHRDQANEVRGVQDLFAQAADTAVMKGASSQLAGLFVGENASGAALPDRTGTAIGIDRNHPENSATTGSPTLRTAGNDSARSTNSKDAHPGSNDSATGNQPTGGTLTTSAKNEPSPNASDAKSSPAASANTGNDQHGALIDQFNAAWKEKYQQNFKIADRAVVFNDIKADDIMSNTAQPAGAHLEGTTPSGRESGIKGESTGPSTSAGGTAGNSTGNSTSPRAEGAGNTGNGTAGATGTGTTNTGATGSGTSGAGATGTGAAGIGNGATNGTSGGTTPLNPARTGADPNRAAMISQEVDVNVPALKSAQAVKVRLIREGPSTYRFLSNSKVDSQRLNAALDKHLQAVIADKNDWPSDVNQAQRLVTQHVLMAVSEYSSASPNTDAAQPAGAHIAGQPASNGNLPSNGATNGTTSGVPSPAPR